MTPELRPEVAWDLADAADWYDERELGLGDDFMTEYRVTLGKVAANPSVRPVVRAGLRWWKIDRFPYLLWFRVIDSQLLIVGVLHARRDRAILDDRG